MEAMDIAEEKLAEIKEICEQVLRRIVPSDEERRRTIEFSMNLVNRLRHELNCENIEADVQIEGSIAKDTWLAGDKDIDIFIMLSRKYGKEALGKVLEAAKRVSGNNFLEAYAEHPYLESYINGFVINFVPCFKVKDASEAKSSVDRTPLHTLYVKSRLNEQIKNEIRLLKQFMHGINVYGAEIKVGGFSGYLCEILTLYYGCFINVLRAASKWRRGEVIDIEEHYRSHNEAKIRFQYDPLIVVDPVDKNRNIASSIRANKLSEFILASRIFLNKPNIKFFYPHEVKALSIEDLIYRMRSRGTSLIFIKTGAIKAVPDVLWGQLYKSQKALTKIIKQFDFNILRSDVWSDEKSINIFVFELSSRFLPAVEKHLGPPVEKISDCERFLKKHLKSNSTLSGPMVEEYRLVVERRRRYVDAVELLRDKLKDGGRSLGIASMVSETFRKSFEILVNDEIKKFYSSNNDFAKFLTKYLIGKPPWLF